MTTKTSTQGKKPSGRKKPRQIWSLVTNHQNMLYMLAAGMVMGPVGFRGKHYCDSLDIWPGWIPLFRNRVEIPGDVFRHAISERKHLLPCIAIFDLSGLSGPVRVLSKDGRMRDVSTLPVRKSRNEMAILVRAPLSPALLSSIRFRSSDDRQAFEDAASNVSNVDLSSCRIEVEESLFSSSTDTGWPPMSKQDQLIEDVADEPPALGQALGGVLAMLYRLANRSDLGLAALRLVVGTEHAGDVDLVREYPILAGLRNWMDGGRTFDESNVQVQLFWNVVQSLIDTQKQERQQAPVDVVLGYLESQLESSGESEFRLRLERLITDMRGFGGLGGGTVTELFEQHKESLSRSLLLFCLREHCTDLLEFTHPSLEDADYLLAGILFGARDGWLQLPRDLRGSDLSAYAIWRMVDAEHRKQSSHSAMDAPPRPKPLRELFPSPDEEWSGTQMEKMALDLAHDYGWTDCIQTRITLTEGDLPKTFERKGLEIVIPTRITTVTEEVDRVRFLHHLGRWPPTVPGIESEVRKKLADIQDAGNRKDGNSTS